MRNKARVFVWPKFRRSANKIFDFIISIFRPVPIPAIYIFCAASGANIFPTEIATRKGGNVARLGINKGSPPFLENSKRRAVRLTSSCYILRNFLKKKKKTVSLAPKHKYFSINQEKYYTIFNVDKIMKKKTSKIIKTRKRVRWIIISPISAITVIYQFYLLIHVLRNKRYHHFFPPSDHM